MVHIIAKWRIEAHYTTLQKETIIHINNDSYSQVLETISKIDFGLDVKMIIITKT